MSLAPALWPTALPGSGSDGEVVVSRGPLAERPLARGLPAERQGCLGTTCSSHCEMTMVQKNAKYFF